MNNKDKIKKFILDNQLTFKRGRRNSDSIIVSGYSLFLGMKKFDYDILKDTIKEVLIDADTSELKRSYLEAYSRNYETFWQEEEAKKLYIF